MSDVMDGWYKRPLDCAMPNLDAWRLGEAALNAAATRAGDLIDTGLVLLRLINEAGYDVIRPRASAPQASQPPQGAVPWPRVVGYNPHGVWVVYEEGGEEVVYVKKREHAAPPQGASSLLPALIDAAMEVIGQHDAWARQMPAGEFDDPLADAITKLHKATEAVGIARDISAASPLPAPQEPAAIRIVAKPLNWERMSETEWSDDRGFFIRFDPEDDPDEPYSVAWGEGDAENFKTLDEAKAWCVRKIEGWLNECAYAAPAPVDPESQGSQPASPARELTDAELTAIGAKHLEACAQFVGAGEVWVEGEVEFARAVIAADRALREQGR